jgi:hypothetical protein
MKFISILGKATLIFFLLSFTNQLSAQSIKGTIVDTNGEALPFATIYIRNLETGTTTNAEGYFEYNLPSGKYDLVFQYLGYKSQLKFVEVLSESVVINIILNPHTFLLKDVVIQAGKEDPAYTIMRKAIAKSKYHLQQLDGYTSEVYIKGSGRLLKSPFFLRKQMAKEGIDSTTAFVSESIRKVKYTRPNIYEEQVTSIRSSGDDNNTSPMGFINGSFYEAKIANAISPLSAKAFAYYKFEYMGTFRDGDFEVSKIRVIPRSKGDDVFSGELFIVEDYWSIHSLDLKTTYLGIEFDINQIYNPIRQEAWLPVSHKFDIHGTFFGFEFEYNYLATISDYNITLNQDLIADIVVVDEKVEKELAVELKTQNAGVTQETMAKLNNGQELTRKDLRKMMKHYEKQEKERDTIPDIMYINSMTIDSLADKKDSSFWRYQRPIPLSDYEIKGYRKMDSMAIVDKKEAEGDTIKTKKGKKGFSPKDILFGNTYKVGERAHIELKSPLININFNTVEGYNFFYQMNFTKTFKNKHWLKIAPDVRYAFARNKTSGQLKTTYRFGETDKKKSIVAIAGRYVSQINADNPIPPIINTFSSLLFEDNYMKLYEKEFVSLKFNNKISGKYRYSLNAEYANRIELSNNSNQTWHDKSNKEYASNRPRNVELPNTSFFESQAFTTTLNFSFKPWLKYYIENKKKREISNSSPEFNFKFLNAIPLGGADISYQNLEFDVKHSLAIGIRGKLNFKIGAGTFITADDMTFLDYKHFLGNRTPIQITDVVSSYRLLPYYELSTKGSYMNLFTHYQFRKFMLSRLGFIQKRGIKESVFVNYLGTEPSQNYTELGYSIENIFRVFRIEGLASFQDGAYLDWGIRVGISSNLNNLFSFN